MINKITKMFHQYDLKTFVAKVDEMYEEMIKEAWKEADKHSRLGLDVSVKEAKAVFDRKLNQLKREQ